MHPDEAMAIPSKATANNNFVFPNVTSHFLVKPLCQQKVSYNVWADGDLVTSSAVLCAGASSW